MKLTVQTIARLNLLAGGAGLVVDGVERSAGRPVAPGLAAAAAVCVLIGLVVLVIASSLTRSARR